MEQQSTIFTDKTSVTDDSTVLNKPSLLIQEPQVDRLRKILLILISILTVLCLVNFALNSYAHVTTDSLHSQLPNSSSQLMSIIISTIYYGFGLLVTYRRNQTGLLAFGWLGSVSLLLILAIVIVVVIGIIVTTSRIGFAPGIIITIIFIIISLTAVLLQIVAVRYAFTLSKLLTCTKHLVAEHI